LLERQRQRDPLAGERLGMLAMTHAGRRRHGRGNRRGARHAGTTDAQLAGAVESLRSTFKIAKGRRVAPERRSWLSLSMYLVQLRIAAYGSLLTTMFFLVPFFHRKGPVK
jgi:hypothetical protein